MRTGGAVITGVVVLCCVVGIGLLAAPAAGAGPEGMAGNGTESDPYVITNATQLQAMQQELGAHYLLGNDVDASDTANWNGGAGFEPVGNATDPHAIDARVFAGSLDGDGHVIGNLSVDRSGSQDNGGLFGAVDGATITDVGLANVSIVAEEDSGGIVGDLTSGTVSRSFVTGDVAGSHAGGIAGQSNGEIQDSHANATVHGGQNSGGLVGYNGYSATLVDSYAVGLVTLGDTDDRVGAIVGYNAGTVTDVYWNEDVVDDADSGIGRTEGTSDVVRRNTSEMTGAAASDRMDALDFPSIWAATSTYPTLRWLYPGSNATVAPTTISRGSAVEASVTVENLASQSGFYAVSVSVDGTVRQWANGTIAAGQTRTVTVRETLWRPGDRTVAVAGGSASATETVSVAAASPTFHGGPANLGHYPDRSGPTSEPVEAWSVSDGGIPNVMQPIVVNETLYTAFHDGGKLYALDPTTGAEFWNATPGGGSGSTWSTPAYANGLLYIGSNDYKLHAIDAGDGSEIWNYSAQTNVRSAPVVDDGVVYFGANGGDVTALNATTGEELWTYTLHQPVLVESNPAVVDGVVYVAADDDNVTAIDAETGDRVWNYPIQDESQSDPTVADDTVFVGSDSTKGETSGDGQLYALNATDGTLRWTETVTGDLDASPVYADGVVYAGSRGGDLLAVNATTGARVWNVTGADFRGAPVVAGDVLYVSDFDGTVHAFDAADGSSLWQYDSPTANLYSTVLAWDGFLYYGSGSHFYALQQPSPTIANVSATNPSGQDVRVTFDSDTRLVDVSVAISGPESATLTEAAFTETGGPGSYTYTATYAGSSDGNYTATVDTAEDAEGNDGAGGESDSVTVDATPPTAPSTPAVDPGSDTGRSSTDDVTRDMTPTLSGTAEPGATVEVASDLDGSLGTTTADGSGNWSLTPGSALSEGTHSVTANATDGAGNTGSDSSALSITIDQTPPSAPASPDLVPANDTGSSSTDDVTSDRTPTLSGTAEEGATVELSSDLDGSLGTTTADGSGDWSMTPGSALSEGTHSVTANATDAAGNVGADSSALALTVDRTPPTAVAGANVSVEEDAPLAFDGTSSSDDGVLANYSWDFGNGTTATGGTPTHTYAHPGTYTVTLNVSDEAGNVDVDSLVVTVTDAPEPTDESSDSDDQTAPRFDVSALSIRPLLGDGGVSDSGPTVVAGERVTVSAIVANEGDGVGSIAAVLRANGSAVDQFAARLSAGESRTVVTEHTFDRPGTTDVCVLDRCIAVSVVAPDDPRAGDASDDEHGGNGTDDGENGTETGDGGSATDSAEGTDRPRTDAEREATGSDAGADPDTADGSQPGFGPLAAIVGLLAAGAVARRR